MNKAANANIILPDQPHYGVVSDFIREKFKRSYGATLDINETLFSLSLSGRILAACGITRATDRSLFLEHYTGGSIEGLCRTDRSRILEVSHLAGASRGVSGWLFPALANYCLEQSIEIVGFTGTANLLKTFERFRIPLTRVCDAHEYKVSHLGGEWGSYYRHNPQVAYLRVSEAANVLFDNKQYEKEKSHVIL